MVFSDCREFEDVATDLTIFSVEDVASRRTLDQPRACTDKLRWCPIQGPVAPQRCMAVFCPHDAGVIDRIWIEKALNFKLVTKIATDLLVDFHFGGFVVPVPVRHDSVYERV